ncbi:hypothetical protein OHB41_03645 [Streptomyces sp. NBC_01571]|uniref:hypothetical protein n=1 Tax=Streptomyces sp. NBC_01571 TaxID=2975883 RepID=UPI002251E86C|nr:hypothetical protein [Streptomyces sp. NBC_01571]MCX4572292.1 hypothetical protein [Streptomyces sp. NBC_01571]
MTFPLDIRTELNLAGLWTDISPDVYVRDQKQITRGLRDLGSTADPTSLSLTLNNKGGKYSPRNAMSPLFGLIGRNTPIRVSVPQAGDHFLQLDGGTSHFASTPDTAALDITGDIDVRIEAEPGWFSGRIQLLMGKWTDEGDQRSWVVLTYNGSLYFRYTTDGTVNTDLFHTVALPVMPERAAVRMTLDADNGAGGRTVTFYWAESLDGPWTSLGATTTSGGAVSVFNSTAPLTIGPYDFRDGIGTPRLPFIGRFYRAEVRNGINGTVVAAPDFRGLAAGTTSFTDSASRSWSLTAGAEVRDRADRFMGEVSSWPLQWSPDDADVWSTVQASGVLRRMGQGAKPLDSTLRRRIPSGKPVAYWPMEEAQDTTRAYSPIAGVQPATVSGVEWAAWDTLPSSAPLPSLTASASLTAWVAPVWSSWLTPAAASNAWQVEFVYNADNKIPPASGSYAEIIRYFSTNGTVRQWIVKMKKGICYVNGYDDEGVVLVDHAIAIGDDVFNGWTRLRFWAANNADGRTFNWRIDWQDVGGSAGGLTATETGKCGSVSRVAARWGALTEGWGFGHLAVFPDSGNTTFNGSDNAYSGESAWTRMSRLALEEGFNITRQPGPLTPESIGFQRMDTVLDLVEAAADADGGMLTEDPNRLGLRYRDRSSLYAQDPALTLSYVKPGLGPDLDPVDDDAQIHNDVTVSRDAGASARAVQQDGPLGVDTIGRYDTAYTLSLADDSRPEPIAFWRLHLGTFDGARYPSVTVMLHKPGAEAFIPAILALREGDKIRLTDLPQWVSNEDVDLIVNGWSEVLDLYRWEVTFTCSPGGPWDVAMLDPGLRASGGDSVLTAAVSSSATKLTVTPPLGVGWTTDPGEAPFAIRVAGEVMTVTKALWAVDDGFDRTVTSGWGTADSGETWSLTGTASDFSVQGV